MRSPRSRNAIVSQEEVSIEGKMVAQMLPGKLGLSVVGESVVRIDGQAKVMGKPIYTGDISLPGMLHGKVVRSHQAHALITRIDVSSAMAIEGVRAVLTAADVPGVNRFGLAIQDQRALVEEKVRQYGEAVALVAAETEEMTAAAAARVRVSYQELPAVLSVDEALASDAPKVHEQGNLLQHTTLRKGDVQRGFAQAAVIVENTYHTQMVDHVVLEPEASVAALDEHGTLNIWTSTQYPFRDRRQIGPVLGLDMNKIRVINQAVGGGFGRKDDITTEIHAGLLALATRRPVRLVVSREESMIAFTHRHPVRIHCRTGARGDGKLTALEAVVHGDTGAYASLGCFVVKKAGIHVAGPYYVPNVKVDTFTVYTNNPVSGAMRGFGVPQAAVAHESQMDALAAELGMSPLEFRLKNALDVGLETATGHAMGPGVGIKATLERIGEYMQKNELSFTRGRG